MRHACRQLNVTDFYSRNIDLSCSLCTLVLFSLCLLLLHVWTDLFDFPPFVTVPILKKIVPRLMQTNHASPYSSNSHYSRGGHNEKSIPTFIFPIVPQDMSATL